MIIVMQAKATEQNLDGVIRRIEDLGL